MFGYRLVKESELRELRNAWFVQLRVCECYRWFSGWKDLEIVWGYLLGQRPSGGVSGARDDYARARGTDCYGKPAPAAGPREGA